MAEMVPYDYTDEKCESIEVYICAQVKERIINVLFKLLGSDSKDLMKTAEECIKQFMKGSTEEGKPIESEVIHHAMRPTLFKMGDYRYM